MKTFNTILMICTFSLFSLFTSCKKDKKTTSSNPTTNKTQYITKAPWKLTNIQGKINSGSWINLFSSMQPCELDNTITFLASMLYIDDEGATKCDTSDPQSTTVNWAFYSNETQYSVNYGGGFIFHYPILILNDNTLKTSLTVVNSPDTTYIEITYGH
jgi:hypothetical protein